MSLIVKIIFLQTPASLFHEILCSKSLLWLSTFEKLQNPTNLLILQYIRYCCTHSMVRDLNTIDRLTVAFVYPPAIANQKQWTQEPHSSPAPANYDLFPGNRTIGMWRAIIWQLPSFFFTNWGSSLGLIDVKESCYLFSLKWFWPGKVVAID